MRVSQIAPRLTVLGPLGFLFALMLGKNGHLALVPLAIGGFGGLLGYAFHIRDGKMQEAKL